jgi:polyhydroxybutyrate depolymerase
VGITGFGTFAEGRPGGKIPWRLVAFDAVLSCGSSMGHRFEGGHGNASSSMRCLVMRWAVVGMLGWVVGCSGSEADDPAAMFVPPTSQVTPGGAGMGAGMGEMDPAGVMPESPAPGVTNEDPGAGITGGVMGAPEMEGGTSPTAMPGAPVDGEGTEAPGEPQPPPTEPPATEPRASSPCGTAPAPGEFTIPLNGANAAFTITIPPNYDPATPTPLVFAFHGRNQTHIQLRTQDAANIQTEIGSRAVMAYLKSQGGPGWNFAQEVEPNVAFFNAVYDRVLADYCVDLSRVFAVGHSSGGYFANILACRYGDRLRGIGSVAGNTQEFDCVGRVAAMVVHGVRDSVVSFAGGQESRDTYRATNGCGAESAPLAVSPCIEYQGCAEGLPVAWCEHDEPTYQNTNHGWPSFASRALGQFLFALGPKP